MAITTDTLEQALGQLARLIVITPQRAAAAAGNVAALQLVGVPDEVSAGEPVPIAATIRWSVLEADSDREFAAGNEFVFRGSDDGERVELLFRPPLVDDTQPAQDEPPLIRRVRATVTLTAQLTATNKSITVERQLFARIDVLPLLIPSVLALFRNESFGLGRDNAALVVLPADSSYASRPALDAALLALDTKLRNLGALTTVTTLRQRVQILRGALDCYPADTVHLRRANSIANLNQITLIQRGLLANNVEAEDELSSLILLGPPERKCELYVRRNLDPASGQLDVQVGEEGAVSIGSLHRREPLTVPDDRADVVVAPPGARTFGDELSSLRLVPPLLHATLTGTATIEIDHPRAGGPTTIDIVVGLAFSPDRRTVEIESMPTIDHPDATVTQIGGGQGTFDPATGAMAITVELNFQLKTEHPVDRSCPITFDLTTASDSSGIFSETGSRLDRQTGRLELVSAAKFTDGFLEPSDALLIVAGVLSPLPENVDA